MKHKIAVIGSHSALDVCRGAKEEGFKTLVVTQKGRSKTYSKYYKTQNGVGCVDECLELEKFSEILDVKVQKKLKSKNVIFIPHRSFEVYLNFDYDSIENLKFPIFGNKYMLRIEERGKRPNQYDLLEKANILYPKQFKDPKKIDRLCIVKVLEKERGFERAFFLVKSYKDFIKESKRRIKNKSFTKKQLGEAVIEEFVLGVQVNFNFFYSPISKRLELLGTDTRRQTNLEGITKTPASYQEEILKVVPIKYEEAGHIAVTVLESLLEDAFSAGERFVKASQELFPPGIIGPFALQAVVTPGPPKKEIVVIDVSPRVPGSPGIFATPYSGYLYGKSLSVGRRIAMEIKEAEMKNLLKRIIT
ncbi:MAG TPA: DUF1297 domain-containing protein [Patescibacteria group bacterium]